MAGGEAGVVGPVKQVLFVCTANVCRSPMAEAMFNALAEDRGLRWRARSAGVAALKGASVAPNACAALEEVGIYSEGHPATQVSEEMLKEADLVLAMIPQHVAELRRRFEGLSEKCYTLQEYATEVSNQEGIADPYGYTMPAYRATLRQLLEYMEKVVKRLEREETSR